MTFFYRTLLLFTQIELALARSLPVRNMENIARLTSDEETYAAALLRRRINE